MKLRHKNTCTMNEMEKRTQCNHFVCKKEKQWIQITNHLIASRKVSKTENSEYTLSIGLADTPKKKRKETKKKRRASEREWIKCDCACAKIKSNRTESNASYVNVHKTSRQQKQQQQHHHPSQLKSFCIRRWHQTHTHTSKNRNKNAIKYLNKTHNQRTHHT